MTVHASDCAIHNEPALPAGDCDCGALTESEVQRAAFWLDEILRYMRPNGDCIEVDAHAVAQVLIGIERGDHLKRK